MADAYFAAACVGLLLCLAFAVVTVDAQWKALKRGQAVTDALRAELARALRAKLNLEESLQQARKNDNRDARGRFTRSPA